MTLDGSTIGIIGLGMMGRPMARNLHRALAKVIVHNRSKPPMEELAAEGMVLAASPAETAAKADMVITMLTDTPAVETVVMGPGGIVESARPGLLVIDMSTTKVPVTRALAARLAEKGADFVDAPVSGGTIGAEAGSLIIMAGGTARSPRPPTK
jgi:3-hydroxyisobutyrate dehydrogenase-like beta-hydroxyacid dehydrogenase